MTVEVIPPRSDLRGFEIVQPDEIRDLQRNMASAGHRRGRYGDFGARILRGCVTDRGGGLHGSRDCAVHAGGESCGVDGGRRGTGGRDRARCRPRGCGPALAAGEAAGVSFDDAGRGGAGGPPPSPVTSRGCAARWAARSWSGAARSSAISNRSGRGRAPRRAAETLRPIAEAAAAAGVTLAMEPLGRRKRISSIPPRKPSGSSSASTIRPAVSIWTSRR